MSRGWMQTSAVVAAAVLASSCSLLFDPASEGSPDGGGSIDGDSRPDAAIGPPCSAIENLVDTFDAPNRFWLANPVAAATVTGQLELSAVALQTVTYTHRYRYSLADSEITIEAAALDPVAETTVSIRAEPAGISAEIVSYEIQHLAGQLRLARIVNSQVSSAQTLQLAEERRWRVRHRTDTNQVELAISVGDSEPTAQIAIDVAPGDLIDQVAVQFAVAAGMDPAISSFESINEGAVGSVCSATTFADPMQGPLLAREWLPFTSCNPNFDTGALALQPVSSGCQIRTAYAYDLTEAAVVARVRPNAAIAGFQARVDGDSDYYALSVAYENPSTSVVATHMVNSTPDSTTVTIPGQPAEVLLRLRGGANSTIHLEYSVEGAGFVQLASFTEPGFDAVSFGLTTVSGAAEFAGVFGEPAP